MDTTSVDKMIKNYLKLFNVLTDDEIENFIQLSTKRDLIKGDYFIREGETCKEVAFVLSGTFRSSFITGQGTDENIQAITSTELLIIPKNNIDNLVVKNPNWVKFLKIVAEQQYIELEKRIFQLQKNNALQRYTDLIKNQPEYVQNIPLQYLASYLGITQRHLSRIRREISF